MSGKQYTTTDSAEATFDEPPYVRPVDPSPYHYPKYRYMSSRLHTFSRWPKFLPGPTCKDMARAGFVYTQVGDKVTCFSCGVSVKDWEPGDDAFKEHLRWSKHCTYAKMVCG